jgi:hypothetical protein
MPVTSSRMMNCHMGNGRHFTLRERLQARNCYSRREQQNRSENA